MKRHFGTRSYYSAFFKDDFWNLPDSLVFYSDDYKVPDLSCYKYLVSNSGKHWDFPSFSRNRKDSSDDTCHQKGDSVLDTVKSNNH